MIGIEKDVPIPSDNRGRYFTRKYPWDDLEIGDSFAVPYSKGILSGMYATAKKKGISITLRIEDGEEGKQLLRVWRINPKAAKEGGEQS